MLLRILDRRIDVIFYHWRANEGKALHAYLCGTLSTCACTPLLTLRLYVHGMASKLCPFFPILMLDIRPTHVLAQLSNARYGPARRSIPFPVGTTVLTGRPIVHKVRSLDAKQPLFGNLVEPIILHTHQVHWLCTLRIPRGEASDRGNELFRPCV